MKQKHLLLIGDSLIEYYNWQARFPTHHIYNLGIAGETVQELHRRLPSIITMKQAPDSILLMTGTNNVAMEDFSFGPVFESIIADLKSAFPNTEIFINEYKITIYGNFMTFRKDSFPWLGR